MDSSDSLGRLLAGGQGIDGQELLNQLELREMAVLCAAPSEQGPVVDRELTTLALLRLVITGYVCGPLDAQLVLAYERAADRLYSLSISSEKPSLEAAARGSMRQALAVAELLYGESSDRLVAIAAKLALWEEQQSCDPEADRAALDEMLEAVGVPSLLEELRRLEYWLTDPGADFASKASTGSLAILMLSIARVAYGHDHAGVLWKLWQLGREIRALDPESPVLMA